MREVSRTLDIVRSAMLGRPGAFEPAQITLIAQVEGTPDGVICRAILKLAVDLRLSIDSFATTTIPTKQKKLHG